MQDFIFKCRQKAGYQKSNLGIWFNLVAKLFSWLWVQGRSLQEQNLCHKNSWESFAFVDEEEEEEKEKVSLFAF